MEAKELIDLALEIKWGLTRRDILLLRDGPTPSDDAKPLDSECYPWNDTPLKTLRETFHNEGDSKRGS